MRKIPIGITGGPASGKSTVLAQFAEFGFRTVSADDIVRDQWLDPEFQTEFAANTGWSGGIDKKRIAERAFEDAEFRNSLEKLFHTKVLKFMIGAGPDVAEVPLLYETCIQDLFDCVVSVSCGELEQLRRLTLRLGDAETALKLVNSQLSESAKNRLADWNIRTDGSALDVNTSVRTILVQTGLLDGDKDRRFENR